MRYKDNHNTFHMGEIIQSIFFCGLKFQSHGKKLKSPEKPLKLVVSDILEKSENESYP